MRKAYKFVLKLEEAQKIQLKQIQKESGARKERQRSQAILLSNRGYSINEIAQIIEVNRDSISCWLDRWEELSFEGLKDKARSGNPGILTSREKELVIELFKENPNSITNIIAKLKEKTGKLVSNSTIKRILKADNFRWKRVRKSMEKKPNEE